MLSYKKLIKDVKENGEKRITRSGETISTFGRMLKFDMADGFPAVTSKKLAWQSVVGELLWFLSGKTDLPSLRIFTFGSDEGQRTIWTDDYKRWEAEIVKEYGLNGIRGREEHLGMLYGYQWRNFGGYVDQIQKLIDSLKNSPESRYHLVMAWDASIVEDASAALPPCHIGFQCYVTAGGKLNLHWHQRSWDLFLGAPFNIASYALLLHLLAKWTGYEPGTLSVFSGDTHIYTSHMDAVEEYLNNIEHELPELVLPEGTETLESTLKLTALDFRGALSGYGHGGAIKAPLSVGA